MATFIALIDYTDQGVRAIKESPQRAAGFIDTARQHGVEVQQQYWTVGGHDGVAVLEAADDERVAALMLDLASQGKVRTHTMRAYDSAEMNSIIDKMG